jgi:hypothetical protein
MTFQTVEGTLYNGIVATLSDQTGKLANNPRQVTIDWGDGASTRGLLMAGTAGSIEVLGQHTYAEEGSYAVSVNLTVPSGGGITIASTALVSDAPLTGTPITIQATHGTAFSGAVASFTDANPNAKASDYKVTITWGDGQTSAGTVVANGTGGFNVIGTNNYATSGTLPLTVTIQDPGGSSVTVNSTAQVA